MESERPRNERESVNSGRLLDSHEDWRYNARLNPHRVVEGPNGISIGSNAPNDFSTYADGYKRLADIGVAHIADARYDVDVLVYSIVFCYRQYLELRLKELIKTSGSLLDQSVATPNEHDLLKLWKLLRPLLELIWPEQDAQTERNNTESVIAQFQELDPGSYAFRYPVNRNGQDSLPGLKHLNVKQVSEVIERVAPVLDGASDGIEYYLEEKGQMLMEGYQEALQYSEPPDYSQ